MPFCVECGKQIPDDARLCPYCGKSVEGMQAAAGAKPVSELFTVPSKSGFDTVSKDQTAQQYWFKRILAFIIDSIIIGVMVWIVVSVVAIPTLMMYPMGYQFYQPYSWFGFGLFPMLSGVLSVGYFTLADLKWRGTLGKSLMGLKVVMDSGGVLTRDKALIRNVSKIYWVLLLLDLIGGLATGSDYRKKFTDKYAGTVVTTK
jgi:uncharacterized RDD family membrane protein YckC